MTAPRVEVIGDAELLWLSRLQRAADKLIRRRQRVSADTCEVMISDINAVSVCLGMLHEIERKPEQARMEV